METQTPTYGTEFDRATDGIFIPSALLLPYRFEPLPANASSPLTKRLALYDQSYTSSPLAANEYSANAPGFTPTEFAKYLQVKRGRWLDVVIAAAGEYLNKPSREEAEQGANLAVRLTAAFGTLEPEVVIDRLSCETLVEWLTVATDSAKFYLKTDQSQQAAGLIQTLEKYLNVTEEFEGLETRDIASHLEVVKQELLHRESTADALVAYELMRAV